MLERIFRQECQTTLDEINLLNCSASDGTDLSQIPGLPQVISTPDSNPSPSAASPNFNANQTQIGQQTMSRARYQRFANGLLSGNLFVTCFNIVERYRYILFLDVSNNRIKKLDAMLELKYLCLLNAKFV